MDAFNRYFFIVFVHAINLGIAPLFAVNPVL